jgi:hypothetical protein
MSLRRLQSDIARSDAKEIACRWAKNISLRRAFGEVFAETPKMLCLSQDGGNKP